MSQLQIEIKRGDIIWSYASQVFQICSSIFLLPLILNRIPSSEVAIWYIFISIDSLINLLDFGLQPTIMRNISYIYSGAQELAAEGVKKQELLQKIDYSLLKAVIKSIKRIYKIISLIAVITLLSFGTKYIFSIISLQHNSNILAAWIIFALSIGLNFYFYYYTPLLLGRGLIKKSHKTIVFSRIVYIILASIGVASGCGLLAIASANLIGSFVNRFLSYKYFYDKETKLQLSKCSANMSFSIKILFKNSYKMGLVSLGVFLIMKSNQLIGSKYIDLNVMASFGLSIQLFNLLQTVSRVLFQTYIPKFNNLRIQNSLKELKELFINTMIINYVIYITGTIIILFLGNIGLELFQSNTKLVDMRYLGMIALIYLLEVTHGNCTMFIATKNEVPFLKASLLTGGAAIIQGILYVKYLNLGLYGLLLAQLIAQVVYNAWKWPAEVIKDLSIKWRDLKWSKEKQIF